MSESDTKQNPLERDDLVHAQRMGEEHRAMEKHIHDGQISGSVAGAVERGTTAGHSDNQKQQAARRAEMARRNMQDRMFMSLLDQGGLGAWVGRQIAADMDLADYQALSAQLLEETGMDFMEHAATILGVEILEPEPGESEEDHYDRTMQALVDEMLLEEVAPDGSVTFTIRPEYEDHPITSFIRRSDSFQDANGFVNRVNAAIEAGYEPHALAQGVEAAAAQNIEQASEISRDIQGDPLAEIGREGAYNADGHQEEAYNAEEDVAASASFFGGLLGADPAASPLPTLANDFAAAAPETTPPAIEPQQPSLAGGLGLG